MLTQQLQRQLGSPWTYKDAAEYLSMSRAHLNSLVRSGQVRAIRLGNRKKLIPDAEVRRIAAHGLDVTTAEAMPA